MINKIGAENAFDNVDQNLLLYKLLKCGIWGNIYKNISNLYTDIVSSVKVNGLLTNWFDTKCCVGQSDTLSPTLFELYINDIIEVGKSLNLGIQVGDDKLYILGYTNNVDLQTMRPISTDDGH